MTSRLAGHLLVEALIAQGVDTTFGVPGESYLAVLDGFHEHRDRIRFVTCRQEGGIAGSLVFGSIRRSWTSDRQDMAWCAFLRVSIPVALVLVTAAPVHAEIVRLTNGRQTGASSLGRP